MSTAAPLRRLKDRGGAAGAKINVPPSTTTARPSKSLTPLSNKSSSVNSIGGENLRRSTGKENPRPTSRVRAATASTNQKPVLRAMPRIDKAASGTATATGAEGGEARAEPRARWSTSVPRGRSSSPSEFSKTLSDIRKTSRVSRVSGNSRGVNDKLSENGNRVSTEMEKSRELLGKFDVKSEKIKISEGKNSKFCDREELISSSSSVKLKSLVDKSGNVVESTVKDPRLLTKSNSFSGVSKEKCENEQGKVGSSVNKYPSKLHEKLAFLEGKVKRIATDIKRTKEMLDMNNPDSSKLIISDIQEKISGIEKAMGNVVDGDEKIGLTSSSKNESLNVDEKICGIEKGMCNIVDGDREIGLLGSISSEDMIIDEKETIPEDNGKISVKGLNVEELEARLFPHHKLLRDRTSLKTLMGCTKNEELGSAESTIEVKPEKNYVSPIDENPIAVEFLASLSKEQSKVTTRCEDACLQISNVQDVDDAVSSQNQNSSSELFKGKEIVDHLLASDERLESFDAQENKQEMLMEEETEDSSICELNEIGRKTSTGGWFVSEGESVLLTHDDSSCSFYDIVHCEEKAEYKPPVGVSSNMWRDCWIVRAPGVDGSSGRYVVAASAGNSMDSGFCSWDFYTKDVRAFHVDDGFSNTRAALAPLPNNPMYRRNTLSSIMAPQNQQWWYKPCGPLIVSGASCQRMVRTYDIRDGEQVLKWDLQRPMLSMDYSSPLQWRSRGKIVIAETEGLSLWDVNSISPQALLSISSSGRQISAFHVNNTDAELGGGVRQRASSSEVEGNDGVFCTSDSINILDFRHPSGIGLKIPKIGANVQSVFSRGDSLYLGCTTVKSAVKRQVTSQIQQFSLRKQKLCNTYVLPESNAHSHYTALTQVWGNSNVVMGVCGLGLFVFDSNKDDALQSLNTLDQNNGQNLREAIGPDPYSSVYKARDLINNKLVALKRVRFDNMDIESVKFMAREIVILRKLDHPNIIKLEGLVASRSSCSLYLVFEYMEHDLTGLASLPDNRFTEPQMKCYMHQLLSGLDHCHSRGVLHRDIKGSNLLIDNNGILKIADFGLATFFDPHQSVPLTSRVVTLWYRPPELLLGASHYGVAVDLWSTGCILGELYAGKPIMPGRTEVEQLHKIFKLCGSPSENYWRKEKLHHSTAFKPLHPYRRRLGETFKDFPPSAVRLMDTLLSIDPELRGTAVSALESEFFTTKPLPCDPSSLPKYPPSKEIDAKLRDEEARRQGAAGVKNHFDEGHMRGSKEPRAVPAPDANAELARSIQRRQSSSNPKSRSEHFYPSKEAHCGFPIDQHKALQPSKEKGGNHLENHSERISHSGPLAPGFGWAKSGKKYDHDISVGSNRADLSKFSTLVASRSVITGDARDRFVASQLESGRQVERPVQLLDEHPRKQDWKRQMQNHASSRQLDNGRASIKEQHLRGHAHGHKGNSIHFSGPLLVQPNKVDQMLKEHDRRIQEAARRARLEKARAGKGQAQVMPRTTNSFYVTSLGSR